MLEHVAKINLSLGCLVIVCFFLPWVGLSCGDITFVKLSGYQLTTGKIPLDDEVLRQYQTNLGIENSEEGFSTQTQQAPPKFYFLIVVICALNIIFFSAKMLGELDRAKLFIGMLFADIGAVFMIILAVIDFGIDIPSGSEMIIQTSYQVGYYATLFSLFGVAGLSVLGVKALGMGSIGETSIDLKISMLPRLESGSVENINLSDSTSLAESSKKTCKQCGSPVEAYQVKCVKCGSTLTAGR